MACTVAPCMPFVSLRWGTGGEVAAVGSLGLHEACRTSPQALCVALAEAVATVKAQASGDWSLCSELEFKESPAEAVQRCLEGVLRRLDEVLSAPPPRSPCSLPSDSSPACATPPVSPMMPSVLPKEDIVEGCELIRRLLTMDAPAQLLGCLDALGFEARKDAMRLFSLLLRSALPLGADGLLVDYFRSHPRISEFLLEGSGRAEIFSHCAQMLRACTRYPQLVESLLREGAAYRLMDLACHQSFDISSEAFSSLRELLLAHRAVLTAYVADNFAEFFARFHTLLHPDMDYVARRQALRLLGDMLLDRSFMSSMLTYVSNEHFLQIHMNLLRDSSKAIQVDAFHVFKIFVANPQKPTRVISILCKNKDRLLKLLASFSGKSEAMQPDLITVMKVLEMMEAPPVRRPAVSSAAAGVAVTHEVRT